MLPTRLPMAATNGFIPMPPFPLLPYAPAGMAASPMLIPMSMNPGGGVNGMTPQMMNMMQMPMPMGMPNAMAMGMPMGMQMPMHMQMMQSH